MSSTAIAQHLINGEFTGDAVMERRNPARPDQVAVIAALGTRADADTAIAAATAAQREWAAVPAPARGAVLMRASELLRTRAGQVAADLVREEGKTIAEASGEVARAVGVLQFFGSLGWASTGATYESALPGTTISTRRQPLGVVGLITPWNFPIAIPAWKTAPALLAGNAVVLKPSDLTPMSASHLAAALHDAGLPAGVLNVVHGSGSTVGEVLTHDDRITAVSFTGSTRVGRQLERVLNERGARSQLEMGGKNGVLVVDDADPRRAAQIVASGGFGLTGQACTATSRVYVTPGIRSAFLAELAALAATYAPGDGMQPDTAMGVVASDAQLERDLTAVQIAVDNGATLLHGRPESDGLRFEPVIAIDVEHTSPLAAEEIFGPIIAVMDVPDYEAGLAAINDSAYGLTAGICTTNLSHASDFAERAHAGVIKVNRATAGLDLHVPFGGVKDSSSGTFREQGHTATHFYTWEKTVYLGVD
ncbi:aldehyde dehydrogenase family protein [Diaminobutyricibacter tongyongensis]|uniref:Aldehyde dehydrogenase family protein n=1 Tax=Leifsonia tongyongensis TaxID=1268043 RepID=A0A6L9Y2M2_9MICO|nr:aldehyde dehydrogenase family protein [Diaminobutyricibacter tongyongensis]NEN07826.1 aldehyde dehydrogenase family protein [Diaminobutyricibacter tongyongensis]